MISEVIGQPLPGSVLHELVQVLPAHGKFRRVFIQPAEEIFFYFIRPLRIDLSRRVFALTQTQVSEFIPEFNEFSVQHHLFDQVRGDKNDTSLFGEGYISRQYDGPPDTDGY